MARQGGQQMTSETSGVRPELSPEERELQELAIQERFMEEYRAGLQPRLADYIQTYPEHVTALTEFVARFLDEGQAAETPSERAPLSSGTQRALETLFGSPAKGNNSQAVAETRANYTAAGPDATSDSEPTEE